MSIVSGPDTVLATGDPGDETARRFRYQWIYAAITCCLLLDDSEDTHEVFCEHHEDVLVKRRDGRFNGLQIKTREISQPAWKTDDEAVVNSFSRFCRLESQFPGQFLDFRFLSNHPLYAGRNGKDIQFVLRGFKAASAATAGSAITARFAKKIAQAAGCDIAVAQQVLAKTNADDTLPKLQDALTRLIDALMNTWPRGQDLTYPVVKKAATFLSDECCRASSLAHQDLLPAYLPASASPQAAELKARIDAKRFDRARLLSILETGINSVAPLEADPASLVRPGLGSSDLLKRKLDAGGFSVVSRNSAVNLRDKAEFLGIAWTNKYGHEKGLQRYGHIRSLVLSDSADAYETTKKDDAPFGLDMLKKLRKRIRRRRQDGAQLYECSDEHLEGIAYSLTSECEVDWSKDRPWEDES
ncbi:dsDNA nuclease domain-containing protein [Burkholderia sp. NLJ2]|uniref:dsDNA nuclease domain-containing protein n=1 Tax=Burkholderia sp. NLJ2 TaxID=3090699 RepID=UPI003C6C1FC2